ncbi:hypothetical protein [Paracoccus aeridis]|uniref:hypothetical protein n=1 Tax=Paracoccus aeridis TaxID=1966466 RepID=UPI0010A9EB1E|nr:hypothetical protein [Paracoccus aeridis]
MNWENFDPTKWADAILLLIVGILSAFGIGQVRTRKTPARPDDVMEVAGAIVSDRAVERMVTALDGFTASAKLLTLAIDKDVDAKAKLTGALTGVCEEVKEMSDQLDRVRDEMIRSQSRRGY